MNIYLMRHFKVNFEWKKKYTSEEFKTACKEYDTTDVINQKIQFDSNGIDIYISELIRSNLTFEALNLKKKLIKLI